MSEIPIQPRENPDGGSTVAGDVGTVFQCARRLEVGMDEVSNYPTVDTWQEGGSMAGTRGRHCSYCGSMHPDDFVRQVEDGATLIPTDKVYKAYIRGEGHSEDKFYFQHLDEARKRRIVEMVNGKKIMFGAPGYFYVLPFFMVRQEA